MSSYIAFINSYASINILSDTERLCNLTACDEAWLNVKRELYKLLSLPYLCSKIRVYGNIIGNVPTALYGYKAFSVSRSYFFCVKIQISYINANKNYSSYYNYRSYLFYYFSESLFVPFADNPINSLPICCLILR